MESEVYHLEPIANWLSQRSYEELLEIYELIGSVELDEEVEYV